MLLWRYAAGILVGMALRQCCENDTAWRSGLNGTFCDGSGLRDRGIGPINESDDEEPGLDGLV